MGLFGSTSGDERSMGGGSRGSGGSRAYGDRQENSMAGSFRNALQKKYNDAVARQQSQSSAFHMPTFEMPHFPMPNFPSQPSGPSYAELMAEQERIQGLNSRDELYSSYLTAAGSATDYINNQIAQEQANARLLGIDYSITDELKANRISDYFASIWGEGEQMQLESLMGKYGDPEGFEGFTLKRGDGSKYTKSREGSEKSIATSRGQRGGKTFLDDEEEATLAPQNSILGG